MKFAMDEFSHIPKEELQMFHLLNCAAMQANQREVLEREFSQIYVLQNRGKES